MTKILMLWPNIQEDIPSLINEYYSDIVDIKNLYKPNNLFNRVIRKLFSICHLSAKLYLDDWKKNLSSYDIIIIHANIINQNVPKTLRRLGYTGRIIYWYWNPVESSVNPSRIDNSCCELWSFDLEDCSKYGMRYNSTYYFKRIPKIDDNNTSNNMVYFVGKDKGRYSKLNDLKNKIEKLGYQTNFSIVKDKTSQNGKNYSKSVNYKEVIKYTIHSNCIVEILQKGQTGMSLRVMEALFFNKKLITDNSQLEKEKYYDMSNTYILGGEGNLKEFLDKDTKPIDQSLIDYYDFESWLNRIKKG